MGNSPPTPTSLRLSNADHSYQVQLGRSVTVHFDEKQVGKNYNGEIVESWEVNYADGKSRCMFTLRRGESANNGVVIVIHDCGQSPSCCSQSVVRVQKAEAGLHDLSRRITSTTEVGKAVIDATSNYTETSFASRTTNGRGVVTDTSFYFFGNEKRIRLIVCEWKKKSKDEEPYMGAVAHYYVNKENGEDDVGLSVVVKNIRVSDDGNLDFAVDGPEKHPATALGFMFDEVRRTKTWKPSYCLHCAHNIIQRQRAGIWQSETEDSDIDSVPAPPLQGRWRNPASIVSNPGRFRGNDIGNTYINNKLYGRYRW